MDTELLKAAACGAVAKTDAKDKQLYLPLWMHAWDTAEIMVRLCNKWLPHSIWKRLCDEIGEEELVCVCRMLALTHDIGKIIALFQALVQSLLDGYELCSLPVPEHCIEGKLPHAMASQTILEENNFRKSFAVIVGAHHGKPQSNTYDSKAELQASSCNWFGDKKYKMAWESCWKAYIEASLKICGFSSVKALPDFSMSAQMVLTGLLIMADWIASNTAYFQLISVEDSGNPAVYPERADIAWETLRLPKPCWNWKEVYLMYLTRIELDVYRRSTMRALTKPNYLHGAVEAAFPNERERGRRLWRLDTLYGKQYLMLVSEQKPDLQKMQVNYGTDTPWETREYTPLLNRIQTDGVWRFCLTANPTKSCKTEQDARGKVHAHISTQYQEQWLMERAEKHGFSVQPDEFEVVSSQWYSFQKGEKRRRVSLLAVTYEGILRVTDAEAFRKTLTEGIGRGKAYGMGMLTVMRASSTR